MKLVRDKIPDLIRSNGEEPITHPASGDDEYRQALHAKLQEEVDEYLDSGDPMELADVLEVVYALARLGGLRPDTLDWIRRCKAEERGAFEQRIIWSGNRPRSS